jgi:N-carbamoylputrescine amidase
MNVALIQLAFSSNMREKTVGKIAEAKVNGAELIVLQELHQSPYFCITEDTKNFDYAANYEEDVTFWSNIARDHTVVLVTSLFEQRAPGLYHNTAVVFERDGSIAGRYRKMHIPDDPGFYEKFYFTPGDLGFEPIDTSVGRLGVLICWDQWYPEAARLMALQGAEVLIYPTAIGWFDEDSDEEKNRQLQSWLTIQQSHAIANGIPVITPNRVGKEFDATGVLDGINFWGNSFICSAGGTMLTQASSDEETILYANLSKEATKEVRDIWPFFRDRRVDAYEGLEKRFID